MYDFHGKGCFPAPHSPHISVPEFLQELYAKINECVEAVNECITLVDTSNNVVENWNTLKAECDMTMEQYANTMAQYASIMGDYTQTLEDLENRIADLDTSTSYLETLVEGYRNDVDQKAEEVMAEIDVLADTIVEVGTTNDWQWRKFKSGRIEAIKGVWIDPQSRTGYDGNDLYTLHYDVTFPFPLAPGRCLWLQPCTKNTYGCVMSSTENYASIRLQADHAFTVYQTVDVFCRLEGVLVEET